MAEEKVAHAVCPYCYPDDPRTSMPEGTPLPRWCGEVVPLDFEPVTSSSQFCEKCQVPNSECGTCGARMTFLGVMPPKDRGK